MDIRYSVNQRDVKRYTSQELRNEFLIEKVFIEDDVTAVYSHVDRVVTLGALPKTQKLNIEKNIDCWKNFGVDTFLERRELGIINIGGEGTVYVTDAQGAAQTYDMGTLYGLYLPMGTKKVEFESRNAQKPAKFYMCSAPAHRAYPAKLITQESANKVALGSSETSNKRVIYQFIHPAVLETCQLSMGCTALDTGSVWNTMPVHTHERRMEVYFYFNIPEDNIVFHFMGEGRETRHIVMQNEQAVISPSWSIHAGCGTSNYTFIWAMAGENRVFDDMDGIKTTDLR